MKTITSKIRGLVSILLVVCIFASLPLTTFATEGKAAYIITYHVGAYDVFTDVEGNMSVTIDGVKYYYSDDYGRYDDISDNFHSMKNTNVLYELQNNEIVRVYSLDNVLVPSVKAEPSVKEGLFYKNGKFSQTNFDLTIKVTNQLNNTFQGKNLLNYLSTTEKNRLYTTLKKLEIEPSGQVDFGSSGWWLWKDYKTNIAENHNDDIKVNETKEYRYTVNLRNNKALNQSEYNIEFYTKPTFDFGTLNRITSKVKVGNLDYQEEKTETKKAKSNAGKTASEAATKLEGLKTAIQFSNNILTSEQQKEVNEEVNLWISQLILARNVDKSDLSGKISQDIAKKWLSKLGVDSGVLLSPGVIKATHYLKTKTSGGTEIFIEFNINITSFTFGNSGLPTMASGSGSATIYDMNGQKLDSSTILPAYADVCAFCKQLQAVAKCSILDITKQYRSIFGVDSNATAEALSSEIMGKILNSKYTKNVFKRISARDVKAVLKKIISDGDKKCTDKIFELLTTPSKNSTLISVKCPVDVTVYDNDGKICGMVKNNVVDTSYNDVFINVVGDQKNIYLIGDDYTFTMTGTDSGKMDYVVKEFDEQGNTTGTITYENIRLTNDCKYYSYVPEAINHDSVLFNLSDNNGNVISATTGIDFEENVNYSGSCGDNAYWRLSDDGVLTIYGSGEMYNNYNYFPWYDYSERITKVYIAYGITSIGNKAFNHCDSLTSITIPNSVTSINNVAFAWCKSLTSITIPNSVTSIGDSAFYKCISLTRIIIPNSVTSIGERSFFNCENLISITVSNRITSIGEYAFSNCTSLLSITIPNGVTGISDGTFYECTSLTSITLPNSVTSIGDSTFYECTSLTSITLPNSVTSIGDSTFYECTSLTSIALPNSVTSIGDSTFYECTSLTVITIPNSVTSIGYSAFAGCKSLTSITIPDSVLSIGEYTFNDCTSLTSAIIHGSNISIGNYAFARCKSLTNITIPDGVASIGDYAFYKCASLTSVTIPNGAKSIGDYAFFDCTNLTSITIHDSVISIGDYAFYKCTSLTNVTSSSSTSITVPDGTINIGNYAFAECKSLISIAIPNSVTSIGEYAFSDCTSLVSIIIPNNVTSIDEGVFEWCTSLTSIIIPDSVTSIGKYAFSECTSLTGITLPNSLKSIKEGLFGWCTNLTSIIIPNSVTSIGNDAFYYCEGLISITIPDGITSIGNYAFAWCKGLTSITIPDGVTNIGEYTFKGCHDLEKIIVDKNNSTYSSVDGVLFNKSQNTLIACPNIKADNYQIPNSVTNICEYAFYDCTNLTSITIPDSVKLIGTGTFEHCANLTSITIPNSVTSIGEDAFHACERLANITIPEGVANIGRCAFSWCESLTNIKIPNSVTSIDEGVFNWCTSLTSITIPNSVKSIGYETFYYCYSLTSVTIPDSVTSIGGRAFYNCNNLTIYGNKNSYAEKYANKNNIKFVALSNNLATPSISSLTNTTNGIKLSWNKIEGAYGYRVYQKTSSGWSKLKDTTATRFTDSTVSANQTKTYTIRCIDKNGKTISGYNSKGWSKKYTPVAPTISKLENTTGGIKLTWNKITGVYGYRVYQKTSSGWSKFKDTTATSFTDSSVNANQTKTYTIRCINKNGKTISGYNSKGWSKKYTPVAPTISKLENTTGGIKLSWNKITGVYGYRVYTKIPSGWKKLKDTTATNLTDSAVSANQTKTYTIRCIDKKGKTVSGFYSKGWSKKYTPVAPTITRLSNTSKGVSVTWNKIAGVYGYRVYQKTSTGWKRIKDTTATSYTDSAVSANQTKTYTIRCIDKKGKTVSGFYPKGWSKKYTAATPKITKLTNTSKGVSVTWNKIAGVYGYRLYRKYDRGSWTKVKDTTSTSFTDSGAKKGKKVTYTVRCIDRKGKTVSGFNSKGWSITRK